MEKWSEINEHRTASRGKTSSTSEKDLIKKFMVFWDDPDFDRYMRMCEESAKEEQFERGLIVGLIIGSLVAPTLLKAALTLL